MLQKKNKKLSFPEIILNFPTQFSIGIEKAKEVITKGTFKRIFICAMGGSALPGEILQMYLEKEKIFIPLFLNRDYNLPRHIRKTDLVVAVSYSGNTEETIFSFKEALKKGIKIVAITSGGKLAKLCQQNKIPLALVPGGLPQRCALGYQFGALMKILTNCQIIPVKLKDLFNLDKKLKPQKLEVLGKKIAQKIASKIPLIYSSPANFALAKIWKIKFNENSKIPAFANYFPELNHNEMAGFEKIENQEARSKNSFCVLILRDLADHPRILKRMKLTADILQKKGVMVEFINLSKENFFSKIFSNILLSDWVSYYLALNYKVDPFSIKIIEEFKMKMRAIKTKDF